MNPRNNERGQAIVLTVLALVAVLGMAALVIDVGSWYRTKRQLQSTADAAALAGAQELPKDATGAQSVALSYANKNGGNVLAGDISVTSTFSPNDTITVTARKNETGTFSGVLGATSASIRASAKARIDAPAQARYVAPMTVYCGHALIQSCDGTGSPKFKTPTTLDFDKMGAPGAFGMLDLSGKKGAVGAEEEGEWILHGFDQYLGLGPYDSDPGAKFESSHVRDALTARIGSVLLFPVFKTLTGQGSQAKYEIIGWIGFHLESWTMHGHAATLSGYFTEYIVSGILAQRGPGSPASFGARSVQLIE